MGLKFFDFFAGIGGFRLGMEQAGHECVGHCEIDKYANMSYNAMHKPKENEVYFDDIRAVRAEDMPECEVYCFGFPCQSFSIAGQRRGFDDTRGTLFFEVMRLAKERHPKILFAENVSGLLNHDNGRTFGTIISTMDELGYTVEWQVINSKAYVPQNRERVFIIGHFRGSSTRQVLPITASRKEVAELQGHTNTQILSNTITDTSRVSHRIYIANDKQTGERAGVIKVNGYHKYDNDLKEITKDKPQGERIYRTDGIAAALTAMERGKGLYTEGPYDGEEIRVRKLTPHECFRLQGFPDSYFEKAAEVCSDSQLYKQAGNSVTVNVIYDIARKFVIE